MPDPTTFDAIRARTREMLAIRVDADGRRIDDPPTPADTTPAEEQPTGPRTPAADPSQGSRAGAAPAEKTNRELIAEARRRAGF